MSIPNALIVENTMSNKLPLLLLILSVVLIIYLLVSIEVQNARINKLKEAEKLIKEGYNRKLKGLSRKGDK